MNIPVEYWFQTMKTCSYEYALRYILRIFPVILISALVAWQLNATEWQLKKQSDLVSVYIEKTDASIKSVKAVTLAEAQPYALINLLRDTEDIGWMDSVTKVTVIESPSPRETIVATILDIPWPFNDRLMMTRSTICTDGSKLIMLITDEDQRQIDENDVVRMTHVSGRWDIIKLDQNVIEITYQGKADPGGALPIWLTRSKLIRSTFSTFVNLQKKLVQTKYQEKPLGYDDMQGFHACKPQEAEK